MDIINHIISLLKKGMKIVFMPTMLSEMWIMAGNHIVVTIYHS